MNIVRRQKLFLPNRLRSFSGSSELASLHDWQGGRPEQVIFTPISTRQSQNLYKHQPLTKHKEERQQPRATDQQLRGLDNFNTSLQSLPKIQFLTLLRKIRGKRDGQPSQLVTKPCASSQLAVPASPATAAGHLRWFSWAKGCG